MSTTTETITDEDSIDPETNPLNALKELDNREVDGSIPVCCTGVTEDNGSITLTFKTVHKETFQRTVPVPKTIEGSDAEQLIRGKLNWEIQNVELLEGEWFHVKREDRRWNFHDPPTTVTGKLTSRLKSVTNIPEAPGDWDGKMNTLILSLAILGAAITYPVTWIVALTIKLVHASGDWRDGRPDYEEVIMLYGFCGFCVLFIWLLILGMIL